MEGRSWSGDYLWGIICELLAVIYPAFYTGYEYRFRGMWALEAFLIYFVADSVELILNMSRPVDCTLPEDHYFPSTS